MLQIALESTLCDFFAAEDSRNHTSLMTPRKVFVSYNPISDRDFGVHFPRNTKYLIQQWRGSNSHDYSPMINLILMPQRMAWIVGKMPVIFLEYEEQEDHELYAKVEEDLAETIEILDPRSRFKPIFCSSLDQVRTSVGDDSVIIPFLPSDGVVDLPHYINPNDHYELLSKRGLALSGLPTPKAQLIDFDAPRPGLSWDASGLDREVARAMSAIHHRPLPFALKTNSAGGAKGTYLIRTAAEQATAEKAVAFRLRTELQRLNQDNAHLHPCSLILTDLLPGKSAAVSLNFYVRSDGKAQFSSFCEQNLSETGHWQGGIITYSIQQRRAVEYAEIMHKTARFLFSRGYHGPAGIDVMTDAAGRHNIVDLNPRPTGSFVLGCFRQHFTGALAMDAACVLPFMQFSGRREGFKARFGRELNRGEIIVLAWFSDLKALKCHMCLAVGGKSRDELDRLCDSIQDWVGKASHSMSDCAGVKL